MNSLFPSIFQTGGSRETVITRVSALGIGVNLLIALVKIAAGAAASSIAILSDGIHSATDAAASALTIVGVKLSGKKPTRKHPFGFGRLEYFTNLLVAVLILFTGYELLTGAVALIWEPQELQISVLSLVLVAMSAVVKYLLGVYTIRKGREVDAQSLIGIGSECRGDAFSSLITIVSAGVFLLFRFSLDAYAGIATSLLILKAGLEVLLATLADLLGRPGDEELAATLYRQIRATPGILNAADMKLHNYGPDAWSGSVNIEIDQGRSVGDMYQQIHALQLQIMEEHHVTMVFGIYAVDNKTEESRAMRREIAAFVRSRGEIISYHALYHDKAAGQIYCDFVVEYGDFDWEKIRQDFSAYMQERYPGQQVKLVIETEYV